MIRYIDSISASGWGSLLKALVPTSGMLLLLDLVLFVLLPLLLVLGLIGINRRRFSAGSKGAWRTAGAQWSASFWISMVAVICLYFCAHSALTTSISGIASFERQYQQSLPGGADGREGVAQSLRNTKVAESSSVKAAPEYKVVVFFWNNYGYIHPTFFALFDLIVLGWFFFPGFKMKREHTKL